MTEDVTGEEDIGLDDEDSEGIRLETGNFEHITVLMMQDLKEDLNEIKERLDEIEGDS